MSTDDQSRSDFEAKFPTPDMVSWNGGEIVVKEGRENSYLAERYCALWDGWQASRRTYRASPEWQPIESAPKDGTAIFVVIEDALVPEAGVAHWGAETWRGGYSVDWEGTEDPAGHFGVYPSPSHWMRLPTAPALAAQAQEGQP
jgi:hypothetical protein